MYTDKYLVCVQMNVRLDRCGEQKHHVIQIWSTRLAQGLNFLVQRLEV